MENLLGIDETPSTLEQSFKAPIKLKSELTTQMESELLMRLSPIVEDINVKTQEVSQNTDFDMKECLGVDKAL